MIKEVKQIKDNSIMNNNVLVLSKHTKAIHFYLTIIPREGMLLVL